MPALNLRKFFQGHRRSFRVRKGHSDGKVGDREVIAHQPLAALEMLIEHGGKLAKQALLLRYR
jgi:hypothetical protein